MKELYKKAISRWQDKLSISDWNITTEEIDTKQVVYNGEDYFIGISRNFDEKTAVIHHDIDLDDEAIVHELLHVRYPKKNEEEIVAMTSQILQKQGQTKPIRHITFCDTLKTAKILAQKIVKVVYAEDNYYDAYEKVQEIIEKELNT